MTAASDMMGGRSATAAPAAIELRGISKAFGAVQANRDISLSVPRGTIHGIIGENGAGKSTLMSILYGFYKPDEGQILVGGQPITISDSQTAIRAGIGMVFQHFKLVQNFTVLENIILGVEDGALLRPSLSKARGVLKRLAAEYQLNVDPDEVVENLSVGHQQRVEILKALYRQADILILDEPTGVLTPAEADHLFRILKGLRDEGKTIILITHKLREIMEITDNVSVMRRGEMVASVRTPETSPEQLAELMVGRKVLLNVDKQPARPQAPVLEVRGLNRGSALKDINFQLRKGEILGFAGLMGAGRTEVARAVFGADHVDSGEIYVGGKQVQIRSPRDAVHHGIGYLSEDRKSHGLAVKMPLAANMTLAHLDGVSKSGFIDFHEEEKVAQRYVDLLSIRTPSVHQVTRLLSGGNQQKIIIGKWLFRQSRILFFDEPTRGIDVGAKFQIYKIMDELASQGIGVILISSELPEILGLTDRVAVFHEGRITGILDTRRTSQEEIMHYASGHARRAPSLAH